MANKHKLAQELAALNEKDWFAVLKEARTRRMEESAKRKRPQEPKPGMSAEQFAAWIAWHHLVADPDVREVIYLPANAPEKEIRLLEISDSVLGPEMEPVEPLDVSPVTQEVDFQVLAADITTDQWKKIRKGDPLLPMGWCIKGAKTFRREKFK